MNLSRKFLILLVIAWTGTAFAGVTNGGGGKSVVCRNSNGLIKTAELLDLFEARILKQLKYTDTEEPVADQVRNYLSPLAMIQPKLAPLIQAEAQRLLQFHQMLSEGVKLQPTEDSFEPISLKGCDVEQLARYQSDGTLLIDGEIWSHLTKTNQAALIAHEAIYRILRGVGDSDSIRSRRLVGALFARLNLESPHSGLPDQAVDCQSTYDPTSEDYTRFYAYNDPQGQLVIQFVSVHGVPLISKATTIVDRIDHRIFFVTFDGPEHEARYQLNLHSAIDAGAIEVFVRHKFALDRPKTYAAFKIRNGQPMTPEFFFCGPVKQ